MVIRYENPQLQQSVQHWKESQQKSDSLKQWALALGVPAVLLYVFRPAGRSVPLDEDLDGTVVATDTHYRATPIEAASLPPISPVLLVVILTIFVIVASRVFRHRIPTPLFQATNATPQNSNTAYSTPRVVDIQPGEVGSFAHCQHSPPTFGNALNSQESLLSSRGRQNPFGSSCAYQTNNSNVLFQQQPQYHATSKYTPIPQAPTEGIFAKHWALQSSTSIEETYKDFPDVVEMGAQLMEIVEKCIVQPLLVKLDQSDQMWESELSRVGLKLVSHDPTLRSGDRRNPNCVSVFDRYLPQPLANHQMAADAWGQRQSLEVYFLHPSFPHTSRGYVIQRLRDWCQRGLRYGYRCYEKDVASGITDGHIVENLLVKMLDQHTDFSKKYLQTPSLCSSVSSLFGAWGGLGSGGTVFLKPVRSDTVEYEVQNADGVRKLRPGDKNIFEAFALFFLLKGRDRDRSLSEFPQSIQALAQISTRPW